MFVRGIIPDKQNRRRVINVAHGCSHAGVPHPYRALCDMMGILNLRNSRRQGREVRRAVMVDIVGSKNHAREFLQKIIFFVSSTGRADYADRTPALTIKNALEPSSHHLESFFPCRRNQASAFADQGLRQAVFIVCEVESISALNAKKIAINAALVTIVAAHDLHSSIRPPHAESSFASVRTMGACGADVVHLPRPRLVTIGTGGQRPDRADVDAHAAFFALKMILLIGDNRRNCAPIIDTERPNVHSLAAHAHAAVTQNASWPIKVNYRRPLLFITVLLEFDELRFRSAVRERHVLQFALAARVAHWAI